MLKKTSGPKKQWVGLCFTFNLDFSLIKVVGENVSWGQSRPVSVRWVILCGRSGCRSVQTARVFFLRPAQVKGWCGREWKICGWLNLFLVCDRCVFMFCFSSLLKSLFAGQGGGSLVAQPDDCICCDAFKASSPLIFQQAAEIKLWEK